MTTKASISRSRLTLCLIFLLAGCNQALLSQISRDGVSISNDVLSVTQSDTWGGAVMSFKYKGTEFIDVRDPGRLLQFSAYGKEFSQFTSDGYLFSQSKRVVINPNQAGDAIRKASSVEFIRREGTERLVAKCIPREWFVRQWPDMTENGGAAFETARVTTTTSLLKGYGGQVAQIDYHFKTPRAAQWNTEIPALYMLTRYGKFYGYDAEKNIAERIINPTVDRVVHRVNIGGVMASTSTDGKTIGIYGASRSQGGHFTNDWIGLTRTFPNTTKLGAESSRYFIGEGVIEIYTTYIVAGSNPEDVQSIMRQLYLDGYRAGPHVTSLNRTIEAGAFDAESDPGDNNIVYALGNEVHGIETQTWVRFSDIDFGNEAAYFLTTVNSERLGGDIELRLDTVDGPLVGTINIPADLKQDDAVTYSTELVQSVTGVHDVYLYFTGTAEGNLFSLETFSINSVLWEEDPLLGLLIHDPTGWSYWLPGDTGWGYLYLIDREENGQGWIYHSSQGWLYVWPGSVSQGGFWAWSQDSGYLHASTAYGGSFYHHESGMMTSWVR